MESSEIEAGGRITDPHVGEFGGGCFGAVAASDGWDDRVRCSREDGPGRGHGGRVSRSRGDSSGAAREDGKSDRVGFGGFLVGDGGVGDGGGLWTLGAGIDGGGVDATDFRWNDVA